MGRLRPCPHPQREGLPNAQAVMAAGGGSPSAREREPAHGAWLGAHMVASFKKVCRWASEDAVKGRWLGPQVERQVERAARLDGLVRGEGYRSRGVA